MMGAMVLAAAVLVWGSEYKCSLYYKHPEKHPPVAVAKLLSERERPMTSEAAALECAPQPQTICLALGAPLSGYFSVAWTRWDRVLPPVPSEVSARGTPYLTHFSFRPPPAMLD